MIVLCGRCDADICVTLNPVQYWIYLCKNFHCTSIVTKEFKSDNGTFCKTCLSKNRNDGRSNQQMAKNFDKHIQPDKKTSITTLPARMISAITKNNKNKGSPNAQDCVTNKIDWYSQSQI